MSFFSIDIFLSCVLPTSMSFFPSSVDGFLVVSELLMAMVLRVMIVIERE